MKDEHVTAQTYFEQAIALYRDIKDRRGEANALHGLGNSLWKQGDTVAARATLQQALTIG